MGIHSPFFKEVGEIITNRISDEERLERIKKVFPNEQEALDILAYDKAVEKGEATPYDLTPEQEKEARKYAHTGTRKRPMIPNLTPRQRKPNATKGGIIAELANFLEKNSEFSIENCVIANKERQISFIVGDDTFELTLVQKRKPKN